MDTFTTFDYKSVFENFCRLVKHDKNVTNYLIQLISKYVSKISEENKTYLEIGPGTCHYFNEIAYSGFYQNVIVSEPNQDFYNQILSDVENYKHKDKNISFSINPIKILDMNYEKCKYDICVMAHVIYYFSKDEIINLTIWLLKAKKSSLSRAFIIFNTIDPYKEFGFHQIIETISIALIKEVEIISKKKLVLNENYSNSNYINKSTCNIEYYRSLIESLTPDTFFVDSYDINLEFQNEKDLSDFISFLFIENEINLKELSIDTTLSIDDLKYLSNKIVKSIIDINYSVYPINFKRNEITIII